MPRPSTSRPAPRVRHGIAKTSAIAWCAGSSSPGTPSVNTTSSATPKLVREPVQRRPVRARRRRSPARRPAPVARIAGSARISMSWPLRGTSRDTQTTTGRSPRPYRARISARATASGANRSVSTPGGTCSSAAVRPERRGEPAAGVAADVGDHVGVVADAAQRRSRQRQHRPADLVAVGAGDDAAGARAARASGASSASGAAAPNQTVSMSSLGDEPPHPRRHRRLGQHQRARMAHHLVAGTAAASS